MDSNAALVLNFVFAFAFVAAFRFVLDVMHYPEKLARQIVNEKRSRSAVLTRASVTLMGGAVVLSLICWAIKSHYDGIYETSHGDARHLADNNSMIATMWAFAFPFGVLFALVYMFPAIHKFADAEEKSAQQKEAMKAAYGVKEWATGNEILKRLSTGKSGDSVIGIHIGEGVHWNEKGHMLCVGGTGQGKGVNLVLPALLSEGLIEAGISVVCLDPKGENAAVSVPHFKKNGYNVHVLNPLNIPEIADLGNSRFNPFDLIDPASNDATRLYDMLAMALHNRKGQGENSFFDNRCRQYISLYMSYAHFVDFGNFDTVYEWLTLSGERRKQFLSSMAVAEGFDGANAAQAILDRLTGEAAKTEENIYGTIEEAINILKDKNLRNSLSASDFDLRNTANQPTAIFICIPFEELGYYAPWVRMFFSSLLRTLTKYYNPDHKVLVLLDEFPQLSYMDEMVRSLAVLRGYNVTLWPIVQSLKQLQDIYKENWELFLSSAMVKHWLSSGADNFTAEYITKRMPQALTFIGSHADGSPKEVQTKLLDHYDVINFPNMICELSGLDKPIKFKKIPYWELPFSKDNAAKNPFYS